MPFQSCSRVRAAASPGAVMRTLVSKTNQARLHECWEAHKPAHFNAMAHASPVRYWPSGSVLMRLPSNESAVSRVRAYTHRGGVCKCWCNGAQQRRRVTGPRCSGIINKLQRNEHRINCPACAMACTAGCAESSCAYRTCHKTPQPKTALQPKHSPAQLAAQRPAAHTPPAAQAAGAGS